MIRTITSAASIGLIACLMGCGDNPEVLSPPEPSGPGGWTPGHVLPSLQTSLRGMLDVRGVIHAHSVYSHDACDGEPRDEETDGINEPCFDDLRRGLCQSRHDYLMLTDHPDSFERTEFPDVLLYRSDQDDELVERGGQAVANWAACPDDTPPTLILAGTEGGMEPVGLEGHVADTVEERAEVYGAATSEAVDILQEHGAVVLLQHTEDWTPNQIIDLGVDGFEMFNLHANMYLGAGAITSLLMKIETPEQLPHPDLILLPIINEDPVYLDIWSTVLARDAHRVTIIATDIHRNTLWRELRDGERIDSYRRAFIWLSNHLLIRPEADGSWDDRHLKEALSSARLYGVFEILGYPDGFDYHALQGGDLREMGTELSLAAGVELTVTMPWVRDLDPDYAQPELTIRVLKAEEDGWDVVAESDTDLQHTVTEPGAYRAEVRMVPRHLEPFLSTYADLAGEDFVWIYSNAIYVTD
ncbi:MAG: hypothetical protein DRI90_28440 [Deltaproteobacteria bacterium]|nr:MAG: hypothetical protein DRI90_28440 [Deltaproteobacteria bacterium]